MTICYEDIARRAYEIWVETGKPVGQEQENWLRAEVELREKGLKQQKGKKITSTDPTLLKPARSKV